MAESYTEDELLGLYRDGKDDPHILEKLSDLACKPKEEVLNILHLHSLALDIQPEEKPPKNGRNKVRHTEEMWRKAVGLRAAGESWERVSSQTGIPVTVLKADWRKKARVLGIDAPETPPPKPFTLHPIVERSPCMEEKTKNPPEAAKERLLSALRESVDCLRAIGPEDSFIISYIDGQLSVQYSLEIWKGDAHE